MLIYFFFYACKFKNNFYNNFSSSTTILKPTLHQKRADIFRIWVHSAMILESYDRNFISAWQKKPQFNMFGKYFA